MPTQLLLLKLVLVAYLSLELEALEGRSFFRLLTLLNMKRQVILLWNGNIFRLSMMLFYVNSCFLLALQFMEVIRLENMSHFRDDMIMPGDIFLLQVSFHYSFFPSCFDLPLNYSFLVLSLNIFFWCNYVISFAVIVTWWFLLQLCSGVDENAVGTCSELIFAPIDASFSDDAPLLPSGFRIIPLDSKVVSLISRYCDLIYFSLLYVIKSVWQCHFLLMVGSL